MTEFRSQTPRRTPEWVACGPHPRGFGTHPKHHCFHPGAHSHPTDGLHVRGGRAWCRTPETWERWMSALHSATPEMIRMCLLVRGLQEGKGLQDRQEALWWGGVLGWEPLRGTTDTSPLADGSRSWSLLRIPAIRPKPEQDPEPLVGSWLPPSRRGPQARRWMLQGQKQVRKLGHTWCEGGRLSRAVLGPCSHSSSPGGL